MQDLFFEDITIGQELASGTYTVLASDIAAFASVTRDHHALHTDQAHAQKMGFPAIIAHGLYGISLMEGLKSETRVYEHTSIASLGWDKIRFKKPVFIGDTVTLHIRFIAKRASQRRGRGIVTEFLTLINQRNEIVSEAEHSSLLLCREADKRELAPILSTARLST